jgi:tRNA-specific 2-thiouridylase
MTKVVLGFSGGVDSAVSAVLLRNMGYEVEGLYLDNAGDEALASAISTARFLNLPLEVADVHAELEEKVCSSFCSSYLRGETPNPCILCNPSVKFKNLIDAADRDGADYIATGHYARCDGKALYKGLPANDQSYMLCRLKSSQISRLILPLGQLEKTQVRDMAEEFDLPVAHKPDSMEICFIPDKDYLGWLGRRTELPPPGDFIFHGEVVGQHQGICRYTVGQRRPGLYDGRKLYISRIDAGSNTIELALWEELFKTEVFARDFNWLCDVPSGPVSCTVRVRHTKWENPPCTASIEDGLVHIICDDPVRAPAAGQSAVLYDGDRVLGGGFII